MVNSVIQLKCNCNNYPWGKVGQNSLAARLCSKTPGTDFKIESDKNYAEMWMGTYPVTPSYVLMTGENLQDVLNNNKEKLIGKPVLHQEDPEQFADANHKPEIAVALSKFEAFCGFKPKHDLQMLLDLDCLKQFVPEKGNWSDKTLREVSRAMLSASQSTVASTLKALGDTSRGTLGSQAYMLELIPRLVDQYGAADNGALVALVLMNYLTFEPGEAIWIPADGIHAYLYGDIVECMARSDNVLNTGFCPPADRNSVDTFVKALTFKQHNPEKPILPRSKCEHTSTGKSSMFHPPMGEFNMIVTELQTGENDTLKAVAGPSIAFMTSGQGKMKADGKEYDVQAGYVFFIGQGVEVSYESSSNDFAVYRAYAE